MDAETICSCAVSSSPTKLTLCLETSHVNAPKGVHQKRKGISAQRFPSRIVHKSAVPIKGNDKFHASLTYLLTYSMVQSPS